MNEFANSVVLSFNKNFGKLPSDIDSQLCNDLENLFSRTLETKENVLSGNKKRKFFNINANNITAVVANYSKSATEIGRSIWKADVPMEITVTILSLLLDLKEEKKVVKHLQTLKNCRLVCSGLKHVIDSAILNIYFPYSELHFIFNTYKNLGWKMPDYLSLGMYDNSTFPDKVPPNITTIDLSKIGSKLKNKHLRTIPNDIKTIVLSKENSSIRNQVLLNISCKRSIVFPKNENIMHIVFSTNDRIVGSFDYGTGADKYEEDYNTYKKFLNQPNSDGNTPAHLLFKGIFSVDYLERVKLYSRWCFANNVDMSCINKKKKTVFHYYAKYTFKFFWLIILDFIDAGADPTIQDHHGNTPIHYLVMNHNYFEKIALENFKRLCTPSKFDFTLTNRKGETCKQLSDKQCKSEVGNYITAMTLMQLKEKELK